MTNLFPALKIAKNGLLFLLATLLLIGCAQSQNEDEYANYTVDGIEYFARAAPYNTVTIMVASILIGHYFEDLPYVFKSSADIPTHTS